MQVWAIDILRRAQEACCCQNHHDYAENDERQPGRVAESLPRDRNRATGQGRSCQNSLEASTRRCLRPANARRLAHLTAGRLIALGWALRRSGRAASFAPAGGLYPGTPVLFELIRSALLAWRYSAQLYVGTFGAPVHAERMGKLRHGWLYHNVLVVDEHSYLRNDNGDRSSR